MSATLPPARLVALVVAVLVATACFPVERTTDEISLVETFALTESGAQVTVDVYRNEALRCGREGHFTFVVIEPLGSVGAEAPLWVFLRGGGVGYYGPDGQYRGPEGLNDEESGSSLYERVRSHVFDSNGNLKDTIITNRVLEGYRILAPSLCDHDLHSGTGRSLYPNNPNHDPEDPDTVDGLAANLAALEFVANHYPTTHTFVHGTSAGSVGGWSLAYALHREDVNLTGAVLDSYLMTERLNALFDAGVTPQQDADPDFDPDEVAAKIGLFVTQPAFHLERQIAAGFDAVPTYSIVGELDQTCAGQLTVVAEAADAGYQNNCAYVYGALADAVASQPNSVHRVVVEPGEGHVVTHKAGPHTAAIEVWLADVLDGAPPDPLAPLLTN